MKKVLMAATLLSAAFLAGPAYCSTVNIYQAFSWYKCGADGTGPGGLGGNVINLTPNFPEADPATVAQVCEGNANTSGATQSTVAIIDLPVTITDTSTGDSGTFQAVISIVGVAADIAAFYDVPLAAEVGIGLSVFSFVTDTYGPVTSAVYAGVNDFVTGVINAGVGKMNAGNVPIGPDPLFDFAFAVEATTFTGSFDAIGDVNGISGIHNVSLFVDGIPAVGAGGVPESSTWTMLVIGLVGLALTRRAYKTTNGMPPP